jgi:hypothetical protein
VHDFVALAAAAEAARLAATFADDTRRRAHQRLQMRFALTVGE